MPVRQPAFDLYAELGVDPSVDHASLVAAFRRLAKESHPDVSSDTLATARMTRLNIAREILFDEDSRADYDRSRGLLSKVRPGARGAGGSSRPRRRAQPADPFPDLGGRVPPLNQCPVCPWPQAVAPHCALGHAGEGPRFGGPRRFELDPERHGMGRPFSADEARAHARECTWFAGTTQVGTVVDVGYREPAEFKAVGRIRQKDGVALDPALLAAFGRLADEAAIRDALAYAVAGRVLLLGRYGDRLRSLVCGRHAYGTSVTLGKDAFRTPTYATCACPSYRPICKHALSTWLVWYYSADRG